MADLEHAETGCMACRTAAGDCADDEIYRDEHVVVVVARHAINPGHLVVVTLEHIRNALTMEADLLTHMTLVAKEMGLLLRRVWPECGIMFCFNNEAPCQTVFHAHLHVVPRFDGDDLDRTFGSATTTTERTEIAALLRKTAGQGEHNHE